MSHLNPPYGGALVEAMAGAERRAELQAASRDWPSWDLDGRQLCDLEMLLNGAFSPLRSFLGRADYESVCASMRLADGTLWPVPITLAVTEDFAGRIGAGSTIALRDPEGVMLAALHVDEIWRLAPVAETEGVGGASNENRPDAAPVAAGGGTHCVGGRIEGVQLPIHYDFRSLRLTPAELRAEFARLGWTRITAYQPRGPIHREQFELTLRAAKQVAANLLIHPTVGMSDPGDEHHYTRVRCLQAVIPLYPQHTARLALLPLAPWRGGLPGGLLNAIICRNYGCSHLLADQDLAGPRTDVAGAATAATDEGQRLIAARQAEIGVVTLPHEALLYLEESGRYVTEGVVPLGARTVAMPPAELRRRLADGSEIPDWFTFPEVAGELRRSHPPRHRGGLTVFFTGLSGAGKSTIANALMVKLLETGGRPVTLLDGDLVRRHLSSELGFSKEHRDINIRRIGFVASEITKNGGIAICAPIAPYDNVRKEVRALVSRGGGFILVHVSTPIEVCEQRDRKGLYAKARAGIVKQFTGISDPYEVPDDAEVTIDTTETMPAEAAQEIILHLEREGFIAGNAGDA